MQLWKACRRFWWFLILVKPHLKYRFCGWNSNGTLSFEDPRTTFFRLVKWFLFDCPEIRISLFLPEKNDQVNSRFSHKLTLCLLYRQVLLYLYAQHRTLKYKSIDKFLFRQNQVVLDFRVRASDKVGLVLTHFMKQTEKPIYKINIICS